MLRSLLRPFVFVIALVIRLLRTAFAYIVVLSLSWLLLIVTLLLCTSPWARNYHPPQPSEKTVTDVTGMYPTEVAEIKAPQSVEELQQLVKNHNGPISIGGGRYSMGGQIAETGSLHLDLRQLNKILLVDGTNKKVTVQAGATWRSVQEAVDSQNLAVKIMQSYSNFTVGGSLSVNVHGRYIGAGPIVGSVDSIKLVLPTGELVEASRSKNPELFKAAIGGYGAIGVIAEATLNLADNVKVKRGMERLGPTEYPQYFKTAIRNDPSVVFHNGDLLPPKYDQVYAVTWRQTDDPLTVEDRLWMAQHESWSERTFRFLMRTLPDGFSLRHFVERFRYGRNPVTWRNHEASYDISQLGPINDGKSSFVLQEYFIPVDKFADFHLSLSKTLRHYEVDMMNVSIRHAVADTETTMSWARGEVFAFVLFYRQKHDFASRAVVRKWTRELIDAAIASGGTYYLPYQIHATPEQFAKAYPAATEFFALKKKLDPSYKLRNPLWDAYYQPDPHRDFLESRYDIAGFGHPEEQSFLTLPEWYLVFSSEDLARKAEFGKQSAFPFFGATARFWSLFATVFHRTDSRYPANKGYHFMNAVIGTTTTIEYVTKGIYENTIGRLTEWWEGEQESAIPMTPIDSVEGFIAGTYDGYAKFIHASPWYAYPFLDKLHTLWSEPHDGEKTRIRHWERKLSFSAELLIKGALGKIFQWGTGALYEPEEKVIYAVVEGDVAALSAKSPAVKLVKQDSVDAVVTLPRYEEFTSVIRSLASGDAAPQAFFREIAGNEGIVITVKAPAGWLQADPTIEEITRWPLFDSDSKVRVALFVPVKHLLTTIFELQSKQIELDHVFDY